MLDRRVNKLKDILQREANDALVIRHLAEDQRRECDTLSEVCRLSIVLHPGSTFEQALALSRTMAYIVFIDDYLEEEYPELDLGDYRRVCQTFLLWHNRDLSQMPLAHASIARKLEQQLVDDGVSEEWVPMRHLVWEKFIWTMLQENHWLKRKERVTLEAYLANGLYSISFPILQVTILAFSYEGVSQQLKNQIFGYICQASRVVRLANDLRTHDREAAAGRFTAVDLISTNQPGRTPESGRTDLHQLMNEELDALRKAILRERRSGITQEFLTHLVGSTQAVIDFYESLDRKANRSLLLPGSDSSSVAERKAG